MKYIDESGNLAQIRRTGQELAIRRGQSSNSKLFHLIDSHFIPSFIFTQAVFYRKQALDHLHQLSQHCKTLVHLIY